MIRVEQSEKASLRLNVKKISWHPAPLIHADGGEKVEVVTDILFLGSKITVDGYYSREIRG